jgi:hypothetical protein
MAPYGQRESPTPPKSPLKKISGKKHPYSKKQSMTKNLSLFTFLLEPIKPYEKEGARTR